MSEDRIIAPSASREDAALEASIRPQRLAPTLLRTLSGSQMRPFMAMYTPGGSHRTPPTPLPTPIISGGNITHVVQRGETLFQIALRYNSTVPCLIAGSFSLVLPMPSP